MRLAVLLLTVSALPPTGALAQESPPAGDPAALFDEGVRLCGDGQYAAAVERFRSAQMLMPHPTALENIARCAASGRDWVSAIEALEELAALPEGAVSAERQLEIRRELQGLRRRVGRLRIMGARTGASLSIDGRAAGAAPLDGPPLVTAGIHVVEAALEGFETRRVQVEVPGGGEAEVRIDMGPSVVDTPARRSSAALTIRAPDGVSVTVDGREWSVGGLRPGRHRLVANGPGGGRVDEDFELGVEGLDGRIRLARRFSPIWALATGAVAAGAGAIAIVTWSSALDAESRYNDPATPRSELEAVREEALDAGHATDVLVAICAVAGAAALALTSIWALDEPGLAVEWEGARP